MILKIFTRTTLKNIKINFSFSQLKTKSYFSKTSTSPQYDSYFKNKIDNLSANTQQVIRFINEKNRKQREITQKLYQYLDFSKKQYRKPLEDIFMVLNALRLSNYSQKKLQMQKRLVEYVGRLPIINLKLDSYSLTSFIQAFNNSKHTYLQKSKHAGYLIKFLNILYLNFQKIQIENYYIILNIILKQELINGHSQEIVNLLQQKFTKLIQKYFDKSINKKQNVCLRKCLKVYLHMCYNFGVNKRFQMQYLHKYIIHQIKVQNIQLGFRLFNTYPLIQVESKQNKRVTYRTLFLQQVKKVLNNSQQKFISYLEKQQDIYYLYYCISILQKDFMQYWLNLQFCQQDNIIYLQNININKKPTLDALFWKAYQRKPDILNSYLVLKQLIKDLYPDKFIHKISQKQSLYKQPFLQSQIKIRAQFALQILGIKFEKQVFIAGRYIDFVLQDGTILQIDGGVHYQKRQMKLTGRTIARNVHYLFRGQKTILINIYQYNLNRQSQQFAQLIKKKIDIMKKRKAIFIL